MKEMRFEAKIDSIALVTDSVRAWLGEHGFPARIQMQVAVALDEILSNVIFYAYPEGAGDFAISLDFDTSKKEAILSISDSGVAFNPLERGNPDVTLPLEERQIGGLGIFLVKKLMDRVEYRRSDEKNILTIYKRIQ